VLRLHDSPEVALDTEGDSLHHYPQRLALLQVADAAGDAWLVDPLSIGDLSALAPLFAAPAPILVLHAGDNDLAHLKARYGFAFAGVFDTSVAARFLGVRTLGLDVLLGDFLGVTLPPSRQKDDWSVRPLSPAQEDYALADVTHLMALRARLIEALVRAGRLSWVEEECAALAAEPPPEREEDPFAYARLKGARDLDLRHLAVLRAVVELRERLALAADRPPFKVLSDATLLAIAAVTPRTLAELGAIPGCTPRVVGRWGEALLGAVGEALALSESELPVLPRSPRPPVVPQVVRRRIEALREWRGRVAPVVDLDPGVLLPNRLIRAIAEAGSKDVDALARVEGVRQWRVQVFGRDLVEAMR
jgi:ribonuclease D